MAKISEYRQGLIDNLNHRVEEKIIEKANADLLIKLVERVDTDYEASMIEQMGSIWRTTGLYFDGGEETLSLKEFIKTIEA